MSSKPKTKAPAPTPKSRALQMEEKPGQTRDQLLAKIATDGLLINTSTMIEFSKGVLGELSLTDCLHALSDSTKTVHGGDLKGSETMLNSQAAALNSIFNEMARRAAMNMGEYIGAMETYLRLAFKAQSQCTRTLEVLAAIKNPPVVIARQANINNGGQQQVNNGTPPAPAPSPAHIAQARTHAANSSTEQNELLEASHGERLDTRTTSPASGAHQELEAVGTVDRPED